MKTIRLKFLDCWTGHQPEEDKYFEVLSKYFNVEISENPDYIIDEGLGHEHLSSKYDKCIKIISIGENCVPDFNLFDYAIGFDNLTLDDRYLRMPLFVFYSEFAKLSNREFPSDDELLNSGFCSFVVSNGGGDPLRTEFFRELSKYKPVASGGRYLNNVGGRVKDKNKFCSKFKFNIAFENSVSPGYTTEKIMQPYTVFSLPIYYGNPLVGDDFSIKSMIRVTSRNDVKRAIDEIIYLDTHDDAYLERLKASCMVHPVSWYEEQFSAFLRNIFDKPIEESRRLVKYGMQNVYRHRLRNLYRVDDLLKAPFRVANNIRKYFK